MVEAHLPDHGRRHLAADIGKFDITPLFLVKQGKDLISVHKKKADQTDPPIDPLPGPSPSQGRELLLLRATATE
ncbi:MAG: hypothetical protein BroJett011_27150 [Chloroflexota bacterium]|nr:MAG: hypothetical protein BroJett011_27150 [Chloroflexota bacterium]